nr:putative RNA-dependent RNA polymerase [Poaceae Liege totivirus 19]
METSLDKDKVRTVYSKRVLTKKNIPVWVTIRGTNLSLQDRDKAKYVLSAVLPEHRIQVGGFNRYLVSGHTVPGRAVKCEDVWLLYTSVKAVTKNLPPIVRRTISAMYSCVDGYDFSDIDTTRYLRREFKVNRKVIAHTVNVPPPREGEFERLAITAEHHTHYRPEEIWKVAQKHNVRSRAMSIVLRNLRKVTGITEATVSTFLAYIMVCRLQVAYIVATSERIWESRTVEQLASVLKELSTPLKSMHNSEICDLTEMFELQCLVNRGIGEVDWKKEKKNRIDVDVVKVDPKRVYGEARSIFGMGQALGYRYRTLSLDDYVKSRWEWAPGGSVHSQYEADEPYIAEDFRQKTKFATLNAMPDKHIKAMFNRRKQIQAWASIKYEWAKQRAIYGVDLTSTVITNLALFRCEEVFKHRFPVGEEAAAYRVHKRLKMMLSDSESFCYDFDDFNAQHDTDVMKAVLQAYADTFAGDMSEDQQKAMEWVIGSLDDVTINNNVAPQAHKYKPKGTLLSGWRLTTFMNTALNFIYFKIAGCLDLDGAVDSVHNGDDVLVAIKDIKTAIDIHAKMAKINARAQPAKCNVFSVGEFLRVEHKVDKDTGLGAQYLTRACATLVHSRMESQEPLKITDSVKAAVTRINEVRERSKTIPWLLEDLLDDALRRIAKIFSRPYDDAKLIAQSHAVVGGASLDRFAPVDKLIVEGIRYENQYTPVKAGQWSASVLLPGIHAYTNHLSKQYEGLVSRDEVFMRVLSATHRQVSVTRKTWLTLTELPQDTYYKYGRALYKMYSSVVNIPHIEKARSPATAFWLVVRLT